jgi:AraC-like DNA-binding protein
MSVDQTLPMFSRYAIIRSRHANEVEEKIYSTFGAYDFLVDGPSELLDVAADYWSSPRMNLSYCSYSAGVRIKFPEIRMYRQQIPLAGTARIEPGKLSHDLSSLKTYVIAPSTKMNVQFGRGYRQLVLHIEESYLNSLAATLIGSGAIKKLEFIGSADTGGEAYRSFLRRLAFFIQEINFVGQMGNTWAIRELESMLALSFIRANPSNYTKFFEEPERWRGSGLVRKIEEYIEANFFRAITIEEMASVASASVRTIFDHFRRTRGYTPIRFLRQVRLQSARGMLLEPEEHTSVTDVALCCGFSNLGHFAREYRELFGEKPSQTLANAKARR